MRFLLLIEIVLTRILCPYYYKVFKRIKIGKKVKFNALPYLDCIKSASIEIGDNSTINSSNYGYHINMHSPTKLVADGKGAYIKIGRNSRIHGSCIHAKASISIGENVLIAGNCQIMDSNAHTLSMDDPSKRIDSMDEARPIVIEDNVWLGANVIVLPGTTIGEGSVIAAGSIVVKDIPSRVLAGGNPCKTIRSYQ